MAGCHAWRVHGLAPGDRHVGGNTQSDLQVCTHYRCCRGTSVISRAPRLKVMKSQNQVKATMKRFFQADQEIDMRHAPEQPGDEASQLDSRAGSTIAERRPMVARSPRCR